MIGYNNRTTSYNFVLGKTLPVLPLGAVWQWVPFITECPPPGWWGGAEGGGVVVVVARSPGRTRKADLKETVTRGISHIRGGIRKRKPSSTAFGGLGRGFM